MLADPDVRFSRLKKRRAKGRQPRERSKFKPGDETTKKLMEDGVFHYMKGNFDEALASLRAVIQENPHILEAYDTMAAVYEDSGQKDNALTAQMVQCLVKEPKTTVEDYQRVVSKSLELGFFSQAQDMLERLLKKDPKNISAKFELGNLYVQSQEWKPAAKIYKKLRKLPEFPRGCNEDLIVAKNLATSYHYLSKTPQAIEVVESYFAARPGFAKENLLEGVETFHAACAEDEHSQELTNILVELRMSLGSRGDLERAVEVLGGTFKALQNAAEPSAPPADLAVKLGVCKARLGDMEGADEAFNLAFPSHLSDGGLEQDLTDLLFDAAQEYLAHGAFPRACEFFTRLAALPEEALLAEGSSRGEVLKRVAECQRKAGQPLRALQTLESALEACSGAGDPAGCERRNVVLDMVDVHLELGHRERAKAWLMDAPETDVKELIRAGAEEGALGDEPAKQGKFAASRPVWLGRVLVEARACWGLELHDRFLRLAKPLVDGSLSAKLHQKKRNKAAALIKPGRGRKRTQPESDAGGGKEGYLRQFWDPLQDLFTDQESFLLLEGCARLLLKIGQADQARGMVESAKAVCPKRSFHFREDFKALLEHFNAETSEEKERMEEAKRLCRERPESAESWKNLIWEAVRATGPASKFSRRVSKFVAEVRKRNPDSAAVLVASGHVLMDSGKEAPAVREYMRALHICPDEPLLYLCLGAAYLDFALEKKHKKKRAKKGERKDGGKASQAWPLPKYVEIALASFSQYAAFRGESPETRYNLGRAFDQLGLPHLAVKYYKKALAGAGGSAETRLAAHNLALLYDRSGAPELAHQVLEEHFVVG
jgi:general transcription factor 3C polypeptide 3 (transcription factor C subunit 4)